jgi:hypothetical protein
MRSATVWGWVSLTLLVGLGLYLAPLKPNLVALQLTFTPEAFGRVLVAWQPQGVALFRSHLPVDGVLLLCYGWFGYLLAVTSPLFTRYAAESRRRLAAVLPLAALADSGENLLHWVLTADGVAAEPWLYALAGTCASLKWLGLALFLVAVLCAGIQRRTA